MGFFDSILKAVGFESEGTPKSKKDKKEKKVTTSAIGAKFDLTNKEDEKAEEKKLESTGEVSMINIKTHEDTEKAIKKLSSGGGLLLNLAYTVEEERNNEIQFVSGAVFALNGKIQKVENTLYYISLKDEEVELE